MQKLRGVPTVSIAALTLLTLVTLRQTPRAATPPDGPAPGQMWIERKDGSEAPMPLERTSVTANVAGFGARVTVKQTFRNPSSTPIEAVYTFPLPDDAAVDAMRIRVGDRLIEGEIKPREQARQIYEAAKAAGQSAALLDQERPNIFTQAVANVMPGKSIEVEIGYVQVLPYKDGQFEFSFPMVVGPRFASAGVKDHDKTIPPAVPKGTRSGQKIDLTVNLDAGAPIQAMDSVLHKVTVNRADESHATVRLAKADEIPNRDFVLRYRTATDSVQSALLTHYDPAKGGFFSLILMPPKAPKPTQIAPKEVVFVMDQSGSQSGFPIEKSKELTLKMIRTMHPGDTFNVIGFSTSTRSLFDAPMPATPQNVARAEAFVKPMEANGGTNVVEGTIAALKGQNDPKRLRIVLFNTDGYVDNEPQVLQTIKERRGTARMFTFGIGNSVNRYLLDTMSAEGRGDVEIVTLADKADGAVDRFVKRIESPVLTDVTATFSGAPVESVNPEAIPDVFDERPIVLFGRFDKPGARSVTLTGKLGGQPWSKRIDLNLSATDQAPAVATLWARRQIDVLNRSDYLRNGSEGEAPVKTRDKIRDLALEFGIMSEATSFVAVERRVVNVGGKQRTVRVPVERADGVSDLAYPDGLFRAQRSNAYNRSPVLSAAAAPATAKMAAGGFGGGAGGGIARRRATNGQIQFRSYDGDAVSVLLKPEDKIAKPLREKKGPVEVQITLTKLTDVERKALKELGFTLADQDAANKVVFGTVDAAKLKAIAGLAFVQRIEPIEE